MSTELIQLIDKHSRPQQPRPTSMTARLQPLPAVRAVLFDVYGTLLISDSGDESIESHSRQARAIDAAMAALRVQWNLDGTEASRQLRQTIQSHHQAARRTGTEYPEVDIIQIWSQLCDEWQQKQLLCTENGSLDVRRLAVEFEVRNNPCWPMPGAAGCLQWLRDRQWTMGLISNAQFFTPLHLAALFGSPPNELGFSAQLQFYSYQTGRAKPGLALYQHARRSIERIHLAPDEVLYVGNDMLKDVLPAQRVGFRTALLAADSRSLRMRSEHPDLSNVKPDLMLTDWSQLPGCLVDRET